MSKDKKESYNPKDLMGMRKPPISLIPPVALVHCAMAMKYGAFESPQVDGTFGYGPYNWRDKKIQYTIYLDALQRHLLALTDGENIAEDSKQHHLAHIMAGCAILLDSIENGTIIDNRPRNGKTSEVINRFTKSKEKSNIYKDDNNSVNGITICGIPNCDTCFK